MLKGGTIIIKKGWSSKSFKRKCVTISNNVLHKQRRRQSRNPKGSCTKKPTRDPFRGKTGFTFKIPEKSTIKKDTYLNSQACRSPSLRPGLRNVKACWLKNRPSGALGLKMTKFPASKARTQGWSQQTSVRDDWRNRVSSWKCTGKRKTRSDGRRFLFLFSLMLFLRPPFRTIDTLIVLWIRRELVCFVVVDRFPTKLRISAILISLIRRRTRLVPSFKASLAFSTRPTSRASSATSNFSRTLTLWLNCCWFPGLVICLASISYCREACPTSSAKNVS